MIKTKNATSYGLVATVAMTLLLASVPQAHPQEPPPAAEVEVESETSLLQIYGKGGWMMHVLLVCSIGTIAVVVYCAIQISPRKMVPKGLNETLLRNMRERDITNAYALCQENPNSFTRVVGAAVLKCNFDRDQANRLSMEQAAVETLDQEETGQMLWVNYLNIFATIAPMVGLLGTVTGMIKSFGKLEQGASEPSDLAGGIGEAMTTTAGGLLVGIPAMFFFFFFRNRLMAIVSKIQKETTFLVDVLSGEVKIADDGGPAGE